MKKPGIIAAVTAVAAVALILAVSSCKKRDTGKSGLHEGQVVYIGTYGSSFYRYIFDYPSGTFTPLGEAALANPSYIALGEENAKDGIYDLYAASEAGSDSGVYSYADDIMLTRTGGNRETGKDPCFLFFDRASNTVMTADYGGGSVSVFRVNDNGSVGERIQTLAFQGSGPVASRQEASHIHHLKFLPGHDGSGTRYLLASDLGADRIRVMKMEPLSGGPGTGEDHVLTYLPELDIMCGEGSGPRNMEVDTLRNRVYCLTELSGELLVFDFSFDGDGMPVFSLADRLLADDLHGHVLLTLGQRLADAEDRAQAVLESGTADDAPERVRLPSDVIERVGNRRDPPGIEHEAVLEGQAHARLARTHQIACVGRDDDVGVRAEGLDAVPVARQVHQSGE